MHFTNDEVVAFYDGSRGGKVICSECMTEDEMKNLNQDQIITQDDIEEDFWFCDRCKKSLK